MPPRAHAHRGGDGVPWPVRGERAAPHGRAPAGRGPHGLVITVDLFSETQHCPPLSIRTHHRLPCCKKVLGNNGIRVKTE
eukprot:469107-Prorocentrum_minimum.AAC.2